MLKSFTLYLFRLLLPLLLLGIHPIQLEAQEQRFFKENLDSLIQKKKYALLLYKIDSTLNRSDITREQKVKLNLYKGNAFTLLKVHDSAVYYLNKSIEAMTQDNDNEGIARTNASLGILLNQTGRHKDALERFKLHHNYVHNLKESNKNLRRQLISNYNLGLTYYYLGEIDSSNVYLNSSLMQAEKLNDLKIVSKIKGLKSQVSYKSGSNWEKDLTDALDISLQLKDSIGTLKAYLTFAEFYLPLDDEKSLKFLKKADDYIGKTKNLSLLSNYEKIRYQLFKTTGNFNGSLEALEQYNTYKSKQDSIQDKIKVSTYNERLKISDNKLKLSRKLLSTEEKYKELIILTYSLLLLLIIGLAYYLIKSRKLRYNKKLFRINRLNEENIDKTKKDPHKAELFQRIEHEFTQNKLFLKDKLSLSYIAEIVNSNSTYVSDAINTFANSNLRGYINKMRIEYVKSEIKKRVNSKQYVNFDEISIQTGFSSKPHFYRVFKQFTGLTTKEYLKFCIDEKKSKRN